MKKVTISIALIILTASINSSAQKLPNIQQSSIAASAPLKVDGKPDANVNFLAFNTNTRLYYTLLNDNKNLYLTLKAEEKAAIRKVMLGGITITFNTSGKKKSKDAAAITFPVIAPPTPGTRQRRGGMIEHRMGRPEMSDNKADSAALSETRKKQLASFNEIKVSGINIPDSIISIYNRFEIKAAINFDDQGSLIYEFSIPLNLLELNSEKPQEFAYNIKVNGKPLPAPISNPDNEIVSDAGPRVGGVIMIDGMNMDPAMLEPTDFWGKYILVKAKQ